MATLLFGKAELHPAEVAAPAAKPQQQQQRRRTAIGGPGRNSMLPGLFGN
jgi:hypothetical protein